jgi:hypothetical protein
MSNKTELMTIVDDIISITEDPFADQRTGEELHAQLLAVHNHALRLKSLMEPEQDKTASGTDVFENLWKQYPNRSGKKAALRHFKATVKSGDDLNEITKALENYLNSNNVRKGFVKNGSTWFNEWRDWVEPTDLMMNGNGRRF